MFRTKTVITDIFNRLNINKLKLSKEPRRPEVIGHKFC